MTDARKLAEEVLTAAQKARDKVTDRWDANIREAMLDAAEQVLARHINQQPEPAHENQDN